MRGVRNDSELALRQSPVEGHSVLEQHLVIVADQHKGRTRNIRKLPLGEGRLGRMHLSKLFRDNGEVVSPVR